MVKIKSIKLDRIEHSGYGVEHWCRVYVRYRGKFYKVWQLVLSDEELTTYQLVLAILKRLREIKNHVKEISKDNKFNILS